jgi:hypothetical protein
MPATTTGPRQVKGTAEDPFAMFHVHLALQRDDEWYELWIADPSGAALLPVLREYLEIQAALALDPPADHPVATASRPAYDAAAALVALVERYPYDDGSGLGEALRDDLTLRAALEPYRRRAAPAAEEAGACCTDAR